MDKLFVYGTLRLGSANAYAQKLASTARYVGVGKIAGRLFQVDHYPALVPPQTSEDLVIGDLFEGVTAELWRELDSYEGEEYARETVDVVLESGDVPAAFVYRYLPPTGHLKWIRSGDWNQPDRI